MPKVGTLTSIQTGDWIEFWLDGPMHGRFVASVHTGYFMTQPMDSAYGWLDGSRRVLFKDVVEAIRFDEPPAPKPKPEPLPVAKPKRKLRAKNKPPVDFLDFLDIRYRDD